MFNQFVRPGSLAAAAALAAIMFMAGCGGGGGGGPAAPPPSGGTGGTPGGSTSTDITVQNNTFSPATTTVPPGSTVTWTWDSCGGDGYGGTACVDHSIVFEDGGLAGSGVKSSGSFSQAFAAAGTYNYHCSIHGTASSGMRGSIKVQ
jgi:plastocyanin